MVFPIWEAKALSRWWTENVVARVWSGWVWSGIVLFFTTFTNIDNLAYLQGHICFVRTVLIRWECISTFFSLFSGVRFRTWSAWLSKTCGFRYAHLPFSKNNSPWTFCLSCVVWDINFTLLYLMVQLILWFWSSGFPLQSTTLL